MDTSVRNKGSFAFGPFRLDPARRTLTRDGAPVALTPTVFDTLVFLVENAGRVVSKEELLDAVWPRRVVEESNISQTIFTLRRALSDGVGGERFILTAPGQGYRFSAPVRLEAGPTPLGAPATPGESVPWPSLRSPPSVVTAGSSSRRPIAALAILCVLALAVVGLAVAIRPWRGPQPPPAPSLVVLADFQNLTGDPIFDQTLGKVLEIDLDQSPFLTVPPKKQIADTLALMTRASDAPLTPALAEEVCAREAGNAVLEGSIASLGAKYLLTLTATDCAGARTLAAEKAQVVGRESVVAALDRLTARVRRRLGESASSIRRFDAPLAPERTASLAALQSYSEGVRLVDHGRRMEAIPLFLHAVDLDPDFAMAYAAISALYYNSNDFDNGAKFISKAYALRNTLGERARFRVVARYIENVTNDTNEAIRTYRAWVAVYPRDDIPWANMANSENWLGHYAQAIPPARRALALNPNKEASYVVLARALMHAGEVNEAAAVCGQAVAKGLAGDDAQGLMTEIAAARGDEAAIARELAGARGKPAARTVLIYAARDAYRRGRVADGEALFRRASAISRQQGLTDYTLPFRARELVDLGLKSEALALLAQVTAAGFDDSDYRFTLAEIGDTRRAEALLRAALAQSPKDTLGVEVFSPETRAALALRRGAAANAVAALVEATPYEMRSFDIPYLRGRAYLAAGDGPRAAVEFKRLLDHPAIDPTSPLYPLARLGLARALRMQGDLAASRREYQALLTAWKDADQGLPALLAARREYATL